MRAKTVNEEIISGSVWRSARQKWLEDLITNHGIIDHGDNYISLSFDSNSGGQDNFGGGEVTIEFDEKMILRQGEQQDLGEVGYNDWWMEEHPDVCRYVTGYETKEDYFDTLDPDETPTGNTDWEWREAGWEMTIDSYEHEKEIVLKKLVDQEGLIKNVTFNVPADISLINKLKRRRTHYELKRGLKNDPQQKLKL